MSVYSDIKTAITSHITAISGVQNVYGYEKGELAGYPSAVITCESVESNYLTNIENERKYTFKVKLLQEMDTDAGGAENADQIIEGLVDSLLEEFETDYDLGGLCSRVFIKGIMGYVERGINMRVLEATIECYTVIII